MNALDVLHELIDRHGLHDAVLTLVAHPAGQGWRERVGPLPPLRGGRPISGGALRALTSEQLGRYRRAEDEVVSISSGLVVRGQQRHLALMDLQVSEEVVPFPSLTDIVDGHCDGRPARLLRTGRGYHVYGDFLLDQHDWERWNDRFLARYALAHPLYVVQSLSWRSNLVRLTAGRYRQTSEPAAVEDDRASSMVTRARRLAHSSHAYQMGLDGELVVRHLADVAALARRIASDCRSLPDSLQSTDVLDEVYACGYLHACLEETATDRGDVLAAAGPRVAEWIAELSRDKRMPEAVGRSSYERQLARASLPARIVKLADLLSELRRLASGNREGWTPRRLQSVDRQLDVLQEGLDSCSQYAEARRLVAGWRGRL